MEKIYKRKYTDEIIKLSNHFPVVAVIGARQVGKTTITRLLQNKLAKPVHYIDLELSSDYNKLENPELYLSRLSEQCIVIDEIQRKPDLFPLLRALIDRTGENCQFIITGSASPDLLRQSTESLAGRIAYVEINPFSIDELPNFISIEKHWFTGGFPKALLASDTEFALQWIDNFIKTYIEKDLRMLGLSTEPILLRRFWTMLAYINGNVLNYSNLASSLGISVNTVKKYIDFFEHVFLVKRLYPYFPNIKKRLVKSPKLFITDTGILHFLLGIESMEELYGNPALGNSWEAYCISQILSLVKNKYQAFFFRTHDGAECDLILNKAQKPVYAIEIKYSASPKLTRGNNQAYQKIMSKNNFVIIPKGESYPIRKNIQVIGIKEFLFELGFAMK